MLKWMFVLCLVFAALAAAQPAITANGIVNAASASPVGMPNSSIAQGSMFSIYGTNLGPASSPGLSWPLPITLGGVSVKIQPASGAALDAILLYVGPGQINAILPSATPVGNATATVTYNGTSAPSPFTVVKSSFGSFAVNAAGTGPGIILNYVPGQAWPQNTVADSAAPGQPVVLWGTGLGPVTGDEKQPPVQADLRSGLDAMELWVGGQRVNIDYAGRSTFAALDQVNFTAPDIQSCYVPVVLKIGNIVSNTTTMAIHGGGGMCSDPTTFSGLSADQIKANGLKQGYVTLSRMITRLSFGGITMDSILESARSRFYKYDWATLKGSRGSTGVSSFGACTVVTYRGETAPTGDIMTPTPLDAGTSLSLRLADGSTKTMAKPSTTPKGEYEWMPGTGSTNNFVQGSYTVTGTGGTDVGAFTATLTLPAPLTWTNMGDINDITRSSGVTVNWTGGSGNVYITGYSMITTPQSAGAMFTCLARASAGTFAVPSVVLLALPASGTGDTSMGFLGVGNQLAPTGFTATGLDSGTFAAMVQTSKMVNYK